MDNNDYIKKWLDGTLTEEERKLFEATDEYQSLQNIAKSVMSFKAPEYDVHAEYRRLQSRKISGNAKVPENKSEAKVVAMHWIKPLLQAAAVLTLMAGSYFFFLHDSPTIVKTVAAEKTVLSLPDSSLVALNVFSKLSFHEQSWTKARRVTLDGEAFFKVAQGSRFDVETASGTISVLGTEFNVKCRDDYFEVICYEGLVEVQSHKKIVNLSAKQMFRILNGKITQENNLRNISAPWAANESSFESVPFGEVIKEFERQYNVTITTKNINLDLLFTGRFVHSDLALALKSISLPLNLTYQITSDQNVVLSGEIK